MEALAGLTTTQATQGRITYCLETASPLPPLLISLPWLQTYRTGFNSPSEVCTGSDMAAMPAEDHLQLIGFHYGNTAPHTYDSMGSP